MKTNEEKDWANFFAWKKFFVQIKKQQRFFCQIAKINTKK